MSEPPDGARLGRKFVVLENGRRVPVSEFRRWEQRAYVQRFGTLTPALHRRLRSMGSADPTTAMLYFRLPRNVLMEARGNSMRGDLAAARDLVGSAIEAARATLVPGLEARGYRILFAGRYMPALYVQAPAGELLELADDRRLTMVSTADSGVAVAQHGSLSMSELLSAPEPMMAARVYEGFNFDSNLADDIKVGFLEAAVGYGVRETHSGFANVTSFAYQITPTACTDPAVDCVEEAGYGAPITWCDSVPSVGPGARCLPAHPTEMASASGFTNATRPWGAAAAAFYFANDGVEEIPAGLIGAPDGKKAACFRPGTIQAYDYFLDEEVTIVNESFNCYGPWDNGDASGEREGIIQDYYAWMHSLVIVKSAGNGGNPEVMGEQSIACQFSLNSTCVGGHDWVLASPHVGGMSTNSSWRNPPNSDREEPDVTAVYSSFQLADVEDDGSLVSGHGTSVAAATTTGVAALCRRQLLDNGFPTMHGLFFRTLTLQSGFPAERNVFETAYSTPRWDTGGGVLHDFRDGAGSLDGDWLSHFCGGYPTTSGSVTVFPFDFNASEPVDDTSGFQYPTVESDDKPWAAETEGQIVFLTDLAANVELRASISWDVCPTDPAAGVAPFPVTTDFDLGLRDAVTGEWLFLSQSFDDNNEGFQWSDEEGHEIEVWILDPPGAESCDPMPAVAFGWSRGG